MLQRLIHDKSPVACDDTGLPRFWVMQWDVLHNRAGAPSVAAKRLRYVDMLYDYIGAAKLDDSIAAANAQAIGDILVAYHAHLRTHAPVSGVTDKKWRTTYEFVMTMSRHVAASDRFNSERAEIDRKLAQLEAAYYALTFAPKTFWRRPRALPRQVVDELSALLDPQKVESSPMRQRLRWRNFIIQHLLLRVGLRSGELLLLPVGAVKSARGSDGRMRYWLNVEISDDDEDDRYEAPSIKTKDSVRAVPISKQIAELIDLYETEFRGRQAHSRLICNKDGGALSTRGLRKIFEGLTGRLSEPAREILLATTGKKTVHPHSNRHTCATVRYPDFLKKADNNVDLAYQSMREYFGWSKESNMPALYAERARNDAMLDKWEDEFDAHVAKVVASALPMKRKKARK